MTLIKKYKDLSLNVNINYIIDIFKFILKSYTHIVYIYLFLFFYTINAQSIQDVQRLRNEYEKFIEQQKKLPIEDLNNTNLELRPSRIDILPNLVENKYENDEELKYFGYDYFTIKDTVSFWENLPLPSSYVLGPGDEIIVSLWGQTQLRENYRIQDRVKFLMKELVY